MDSPDSTKIVTSKSAASPPVQDSPLFNYLSNLSPINPVKAAHVAQGFSELNVPSPLLVFTSPRANLPREMKFLRRLRYSSSSSAELPLEQRDGLNDPQLMIGLTPCVQKDRANKGSEQVQPCSPSGCVNEYLADMVEMESVDNDCSSDLCSKQAHDAAQMSVNFSSRSEKVVAGPDDGGGPSKDMETEVVLRFTSLEQGEKELDENLLLQVESAKLLKDHEEQFSQCTSVTSEKVEGTLLPNFSLVPALGGQDCQQVLPESLQTAHDFENHDQLAGEMSTESVEDRISYDFQEAGQHQRGTHRRLQFEAAEAHKSANNCEHRFSNTVNVIACASSSANSSELHMIDSSNLNLTATLSNVLPINLSLPMSSKSSLSLVEVSETQDKFDRSVRNGGRTSTKPPKPSGIGLHLNSIVNAAAVGCNAAPGMDSADYPTAQREKSLSVTKHHLPEGSSSNPLSSSVARQFLVKIDDNQQERIALVSDCAANLQSPQGNVDKVEELNQLSPKRKRKRTPYTIESEGCKRCNCKRSKCLKLYCECFAAGIYCAEPCSCVECFNKPEYEDTVLGTRQQIESRNPLAFAPKIVQCSTGSPVNNGEDGGRTTPSSARHKRGCNCKKSMCLKKYCECYQAGVGCSDGCRCEGCKNIFGIKEDYFSVGYAEINDMEYKKSDDENWEDPSDQKLDMLDTRDKYVHSERSHKLMPQTPLLQSSNNKKELLNPWHPARRYLHSPESDNNTSSSYGKPSRSPRTLSGHDKGMTRGDPSLDDLFCDQELAFNTTVGVDQFSPRWNGLEDICDFTPLPLPPSRVMALSSSSNAKERTQTSRLQLHGSVRLSGSFRLHGGSVTPIRRLGGSKLQEEPESDNGCGIMEDDTPEILKDSSTPIKAVKASSPNQKRVSPPHSRFNELRSSSSPGLRSGRKFVLQSISSFPPLTPYSDPKRSTDN